MSSKQKNILKVIAVLAIVGLITVISLVACKKPATEPGDSAMTDVTQPKDEKPKKDITKTVAVFGVDKDGYRTDIIFLVHFDSETNQAKVVSVPRDTKVIWTAEQKDIVRKNDGYVVSRSKLNEMTTYGGIENVRELTVKHMEDMLDIEIDNYVVVDIDAFRQIVDAIGGVEVDVPQRMYYVDKAQDLYIDLQPGLQVLDGDKAEQLVRFRKGYVEGDIGRIKTTQLFLEAFAEKVMSPSIIKDLPKLVPVLFKAVQTDIGLTEVFGYYPYVKNFNVNNLSFYTLPGEATYEPGAWYFIPDYVQLENFSREVFFDLPPLPIDEDAIERAQAKSNQETYATSYKPAVTKPQKPVVPKPDPKPEKPPVTSPNEPPVVVPPTGETTPSEPVPPTGETAPEEPPVVTPPTEETTPEQPPVVTPPTGETTPEQPPVVTPPVTPPPSGGEVTPPTGDQGNQTDTSGGSFEVPQN
ncbi:MAG: LCP family protein [Cellulosilyticaceae bacterium]